MDIVKYIFRGMYKYYCDVERLGEGEGEITASGSSINRVCFQ